MKTIRLTAPAKVNLFLAIEGVRAEGWHAVQTIYQAVDLADEVRLELLPSGIEIVSDCPGLPLGEENLCWQAAAMLLEKTELSKGVRIYLQKEIPAGAGLGGGSSDAAATLLGLRQLWGLEIADEELEECAGRLGADVPFFLKGGTALGKNRGDVISPLTVPAMWFVIAWPGVHLSTAAVYRGWDKAPFQGGVGLPEMLEALREGNLHRVAECLRNDLEPAAMGLCPACCETREKLRAAGCLATLLCGSGSAAFGLAEDENHAGRIAGALARNKDLWVRVARSLPAGEPQ